MEIAEILKIALKNQDASRPRSLQKQLGASSAYDCKRRIWSFVNDIPVTNHDTDKLAAMFGTAMHSMIAESLESNDPFDDYLIEQEFNAGNLKGHVDLFIKSKKQVVDWKTVTKSAIKSGRWLDPQKIAQVQLYGYLLEENGYEVEFVSLVAIPRDGNMSEIVGHVEPYDRDKALEALVWLDNVTKLQEPPAPERTTWFCSRYCSYFDPSGVVGCTAK